MAKTIKTTFLLRRGYEEVWRRNNPILQCGEPAFTIDKNSLKIGDGIHAWRDLEYINDADINLNNYITREEFEQLEEKIETIDGTVSAIPDDEMLEFLAEMDIVQPLSNTNNSVFTDTNDKLYVL